MIEKFKEQIKSAELEIKKSSLKQLPIETIEKVSGGSGHGEGWIAWNKVG